jgi:hypothetical protein
VECADYTRAEERFTLRLVCGTQAGVWHAGVCGATVLMCGRHAC